MKKYIHPLFFLVVLLLAVSCRKEKKTMEAALKMQEFVISLSAYAKTVDPGFIIVPQNGEALAFNNADPEAGLNMNYLDAIDGFGIEEIFYNGGLSPDEYRLDQLRELVGYKKVMVSEYLSDDADIADALVRNSNEGFLCFARSSSNYDYTEIPLPVVNENVNDVNVLNDAQNYLYLISNSNYASKQHMIDAIAATNFDLVILDLFFEEEPFTPAEISQLKQKANGGQRLVLAYMSVGSAENYRYYWQDKWRLHRPDWLKKKYDGYKDEVWVEYWNTEWQDIIYGNDNSYTRKMIDAGFDGAYLDNVEAYYFLYHRK